MVITTPPRGPSTFYVTTDETEARKAALRPYTEVVFLQGSPQAIDTLATYAQRGAGQTDRRKKRRKAERAARKRNR